LKASAIDGGGGHALGDGAPVVGEDSGGGNSERGLIGHIVAGEDLSVVGADDSDCDASMKIVCVRHERIKLMENIFNKNKINIFSFDTFFFLEAESFFFCSLKNVFFFLSNP
jgi:hypothetical protein